MRESTICTTVCAAIEAPMESEARTTRDVRAEAKSTDATAVLVEEFLPHRFFVCITMAIVAVLVVVAMFMVMAVPLIVIWLRRLLVGLRCLHGRHRLYGRGGLRRRSASNWCCIPCAALDDFVEFAAV